MSSPEHKTKDLPDSGTGHVLNNDDAPHSQPSAPTSDLGNDKASFMSEDQDDGVTRIEALYLVFGRGWKLVLLWASIGLIAYIYALSQSTTWVYLQIATSSFQRHALLGTIGVINGLISAIAQPIIAKLCDLSSRPTAYAFAVLFYCLGYIIVAASKSVTEVAGGEVLFTIGNTAISLINTIIVADMSSLQNRGLVNSLMASPFIVNAFVASYITDGISAFSDENWQVSSSILKMRWGYGMFVIMVPVCIAPALVVLFWADRKARRTGALSLASSSYARKQILKKEGALQMTTAQQLVYYFHRVDVIGLILLAFSFGLILVPVTLSASMEGGYSNKSIIAMFATGAALWFVFIGWEWKLAKYPIMPKRVLNRSLICSCVIDFFYFLSYYVAGTYWLSWVYVVKDWNTKNYTLFSNILTVGLCVFGVIAGLLQRYFHRYKVIQLVGLFLRLLGNGLVFYAYKNPSDAVLVMSQILGSAGGGFSVIGSMLAAQASVPHQDCALAISLLNLWTQAGGAVGAAIGASIWTNRLPEMLNKHLSNDLNSTQIQEIYGSIIVARLAEPRDKVIAAYQEAGYYIFLPALILTAAPVLAGFLTSNFYLDTRHNVVEDKEIVMRPEEETEESVLREKVALAEEEARRQLGFAPEQALHRR